MYARTMLNSQLKKAFRTNCPTSPTILIDCYCEHCSTFSVTVEPFHMREYVANSLAQVQIMQILNAFCLWYMSQWCKTRDSLICWISFELLGRWLISMIFRANKFAISLETVYFRFACRNNVLFWEGWKYDMSTYRKVKADDTTLLRPLTWRRHN